jgi:hypothetical protein
MLRTRPATSRVRRGSMVQLWTMLLQSASVILDLGPSTPLRAAAVVRTATAHAHPQPRVPTYTHMHTNSLFQYITSLASPHVCTAHLPAAGTSIAALLAQAREVKKAAANNWAAVELKRKNWSEAAKQATKVHYIHSSLPPNMLQLPSSRPMCCVLQLLLLLSDITPLLHVLPASSLILVHSITQTHTHTRSCPPPSSRSLSLTPAT